MISGVGHKERLWQGPCGPGSRPSGSAVGVSLDRKHLESPIISTTVIAAYGVVALGPLSVAMWSLHIGDNWAGVTSLRICIR